MHPSSPNYKLCDCERIGNKVQRNKRSPSILPPPTIICCIAAIRTTSFGPPLQRDTSVHHDPGHSSRYRTPMPQPQPNNWVCKKERKKNVRFRTSCLQQPHASPLCCTFHNSIACPTCVVLGPLHAPSPKLRNNNKTIIFSSTSPLSPPALSCQN